MAPWHRILFGPAAGAVMPIDFRFQKRLLLGVYERELWPAYRRLLRHGMKSFDIGGRDGYSSLLIERRTRAPVISFECEASAVLDMQRVFDRNGNNVHAVAAFVGSEGNTVSTMTVDQASSRYFHPHFMKIDVEGGESDVLAGAERVLRAGTRLIVEVHSREQEELCLTILGGFNYKIEVINQARYFREHRPLPHNRWLVATPPSS
jgi:hypothetical protein